MNKINIFVASGNELLEERQHAIHVLDKLEEIFPHMNLKAKEWENAIPSGSYNGKTIQEEIDPLLEKSDIVLVLFYSKLGKFTVHEYELALQKKKKIFLYFKKGFSPQNKTEHEQYGQVLDFKDKVEKENKVIFREYETMERFEILLKDDLSLYLSQEYGRKEKVLQQILRGSRLYFERLRGEYGRFRMLHIEDLILSRTDTKDKWVPQPVSGKDEVFNKNKTVLTLLPRSWKQSRKHVVIVGDGGMGKTVSLIRLWESLLDRVANENDEPVPVFIALNEFNQVKEEERKGFILNYIRENYCDSSMSIEEIWEAMKQPEPEGTFRPHITLLLDGFNEITVGKKELLLEIKRIMEQCPGSRIVLTSRFDMRGLYQWGNWNLVRLMKLEKAQVESYLQEKKLGIPSQKRFLELIGNPMMLTLYAATCEVQSRNRESEHCRFKERVESVGELLWNFIEAQVGNLGERLGEDREKVYYYKFLLKFFLPALGFEMEKAGLFDFTNTQINLHIDYICKRFSQADFFDTFAEFDEYGENLPLGGCAYDTDRRKRAAKLRRIFCEELHMLVKEGVSYRFLHQDFRDFFAAVHILNGISIALEKNEIAEVLKERTISIYVRRYLGEIEGEHYSKPFLVNGEGWEIKENRNSRLYRTLDQCRGIFDKSIGFSIWNILEAWKEVRGELSGADLSHLDLSMVILNGVRCNRFYEGSYLSAIFDNTLLNKENIFPQGHNGSVNSAVYSPDGEKIFSASSDKTIKKWDIKTERCIKIFTGHSDSVNSIKYAPVGNKILSASSDKTIKEWNAKTGSCIQIYTGHSDKVNIAVYSPDGKKIVSASNDKTIKLWDTKTGDCLKTFPENADQINSVLFNPKGDRILTASYEGIIREWDIEREKCIKEIDGYSYMLNLAIYCQDSDKILAASESGLIVELNSDTGQILKKFDGHSYKVTGLDYSPNRGKIISSSWDNMIKEWDVETGKCLRTYRGHSGEVGSAVYKQDGEKILSASWDNSFKEWDIKTGECIKTFHGYSNTVSVGTQFSLDGKRILSSFDGTIKEWDTETGVCIHIYKGHSKPLHSLAYSPNASRILSASTGETINEWDAASGRCIRDYSIETSTPTEAIYFDDGRTVLAAYGAGKIIEWSTESGKMLNEYSYSSFIKDGAYTIHHINCSPDGRKFVVLYSGRILKEWERRTGRCLVTIKLDESYKYKHAIYTKDCRKIILISDRKFHMIDFGDNKIVEIAKEELDHSIGRLKYFEKSRFSPDGRLFVAAKKDKIFLFDAKSEEIVKTSVNISGLFIQRCSFKNLHPDSDLSDEDKALMKQYGAIFE